MIKNYLKTLMGIVVGSVIFAAGVSFFMNNNTIISGGVTGIAMIINLLLGWPIGIMSIVINVPLFIFGWKKLGLRFALISLAAMIFSSLMIDLFDSFEISLTQEPLAAAIYGGLLMGAGLGIVYYIGGSTGGTDIICKLINSKYPHFDIGRISFVIDAIILLAFALIFNKFDHAMYSLICIFLGSKLTDLILYGSNYSKACYIITVKEEEIKQMIFNRLDRGITILDAKGGYSGDAKKLIICAIKRQQISELRSEIYKIDPAAFIIVSDSREIYGSGFQEK